MGKKNKQKQNEGRVEEFDSAVSCMSDAAGAVGPGLNALTIFWREPPHSIFIPHDHVSSLRSCHVAFFTKPIMQCLQLWPKIRRRPVLYIKVHSHQDSCYEKYKCSQLVNEHGFLDGCKTVINSAVRLG